MYVVYTDLQDPGFSLVGIFSTLLRIRTFAKTVLICGDFHAVCGEHWDYSRALTLGISQKALAVQEKIKFQDGWKFFWAETEYWNNVSKIFFF